MSLIKALTAFSAILLLILGTIGCDDHKHHDSANMMYSEGSPYYAPVQIPEIIYMSPSDGTMNHNISTQIIMAFNMPMDTMSVMHNFHMAGGDDMHLFMDSLEHCSSDSGMMGGGMGGMMGMEHMMDWMDSIQCPGHFE